MSIAWLSHPGGLARRLAWLGWFALACSLLAGLIGLRYLPWVSVPDGGVAVYVALVYLAQFPLLAGLALIPVLPLALLIPRPLWLGAVAVTWAGVGLALLALDTVVYDLYRFHLSGFVLELALGAGTEIFAFSARTWLWAWGMFLGLLLVLAGLAVVLWRWQGSGWRVVCLFGVVLVLQVVVHGWHAWSDANYDVRITDVPRHFPLYYAATAKRRVHKWGLVDQQRVRDNQAESGLASANGGGTLAYPVEPLACQPPERPLNLMMIVIDGARLDTLDARWAPNMTRFAEQSLSFEQHFSNGNATKPGIFTLFYGLPASYWDAFTAAKRPPVLLERMQALDYEMQVLASATLSSPAFDQNVFAGVPGLRLHTPGEDKWHRDARITDDWLDFVDRRTGERPFFGFLFYDTTHGHRPSPDHPVRFQPEWKTANKLELGRNFDPQLIRNNYRSTMHFVDSQVGRVLDDLRERGLLEDTVVMITGDHGQEFNEYGLNYWDHGSNFGRWQLQVPLVLHWPGRGAGRVEHRTENFDVAPTLMGELLGCADSDPRSYATGNGLFVPRERAWSIAHSYMDYALLLEDLQVVTRAVGKVEVVDQDLQRVRDYRLDPDVVRAVLEELSRFYR